MPLAKGQCKYVPKDASERGGTRSLSVVKIIDNQEKRYYYNIGMMGDIDNNGTIDYDDVNLVQQYIANLISLTNEQLIVADVNGDGNISIADARNIQKMYYGLITEFDNGMFAFLG